VTVTHGIDAKRALTLTGHRVATLELDISRLGGRVTRTQLKKLVVEEVDHKRWIFNPVVEAIRDRLASDLDTQQAADDADWDREIAEEAALRATPVEALAADYLKAVREHLVCLTTSERHPERRPELQALVASTKATILAVAGKLARKGYRDASDESLFAWHGTLAKLCSIEQDRGIGYNVDSGFQVLNACFQANSKRREHASLCMVAAKVFGLPLSIQQAAKVKEWRQEILDSVYRGEETYGRQNRHDAFLSLLFPALREGIEKTHPEALRRKVKSKGGGGPDGLAMQSPSGFGSTYADGSGGWLQGHELENWVKNNPASAETLGLIKPQKPP